ncbi:hypothetical protein [uncultured Desulfosarcina sp.]|uniref:hypothetical protein n=1 Tax=uncultured Desulfosarcina sp. TaxID=218289 RepID=UPI0029C75BED|nr:hypothetical protein [uncultured Desulfosarcina sp.]
MKKQRDIFFTIALFVAAIGITGAVAGDRPFGQSPANAPRAVVVANEYTFAEVLEGEIITHAYVIVQLDEHEGKYLLSIDNRQTTPGQYRGQVTLKTDSTLRPKLFVYVFGDIEA